jgi:peptide/nickel transport system permease protein
MSKKLKFFIQSQWEIFRGDWLGKAGVAILACFILMAIFAPLVAPHRPDEMIYSDGRLVRLQPPTWKHLFGTTQMGQDIFSQVIYGSRAAVLVGMLSAFLVSIIGTAVGVVSGYYGGRIDAFLMRFVDLAYGVPFLPFIILLVALTGLTFWNVVVGITLLLWRTPARVIRAQVLSLRKRPFVEASRVLGASNFRIMLFQITPNILPLTFSYTALAMGWAILTEANLSFLGYGDPLMISWGKILFNVYIIQAMTIAWWWVLAPGLAIMLLVLSGFFIGRAYEKVTNPRLREF